jgi:hypothetical protein
MEKEPLKLASKDFDLTEYDTFLFFFNLECIGNTGGIAKLGKKYIKMDGEWLHVYLASVFLEQEEFVSENKTWYTLYKNKVVNHELGHAFGFNHAKSLECGKGKRIRDSCERIEYGNPFDVLGNKRLGIHHNAYIKEGLSWLDQNSILNLEEDGVYTIRPLQSSTGIRAAKILVPELEGEKIYLEYRQLIGYDDLGDWATAFAPENYNGLMVNIIREGSRTPYLLDMSPEEYTMSNGYGPDWDNVALTKQTNPNTFEYKGVVIGPVISNNESGITFEFSIPLRSAECGDGSLDSNEECEVGDLKSCGRGLVEYCGDNCEWPDSSSTTCVANKIISVENDLVPRYLDQIADGNTNIMISMDEGECRIYEDDSGYNEDLGDACTQYISTSSGGISGIKCRVATELKGKYLRHVSCKDELGNEQTASNNIAVPWTVSTSYVGDSCTPETCTELGKSCGDVDDGCGGMADCGSCFSGFECISGACVVDSSCTPKTCAEIGLGKFCGNWNDGCGRSVDCGTCSIGYSCSEWGTCVVNSSCTPQTCTELGKSCGTWDDGCGTSLNCEACSSGFECTNGVCVRGIVGYEEYCSRVNIQAVQVLSVGNQGDYDVTLRRYAGGDVIGGILLNFFNDTISSGVLDFGIAISELETSTQTITSGVINAGKMEYITYFLDASGNKALCSEVSTFNFVVCTPSTSCVSQVKNCGTLHNGCETVICGDYGGNCQSGYSCIEGVCVEEDVSNLNGACDGCELNGKCYLFGYQEGEKFCTEDSEFVDLLGEGEACENHFECGNNLCISGECLEKGFIGKIGAWFKKWF